MRKRKTADHPEYVSNKQFHLALVEYHAACVECERLGDEMPIIPDYIGDCILRICRGLSGKGNFSGYSFRDELVLDAVSNCIEVISNYDPTKATRTGNPNPFAYFTQIAYYAFLRRIAKEKRFVDVKAMVAFEGGIDYFIEDGDFNSETIIEQVRLKSDILKDRDCMLKSKLKETKTTEKKGPLDDFIA